MADDEVTVNETIDNTHRSTASTAIQPFRVPLLFIDKNTTVDAEFARKNYHYHIYFDPIKVQQLLHNLSHSHLQHVDSSGDDINRVITIYQNVINTIKENCRMHLHQMICQRCKDINWVLEGGQEPKSIDDVWNVLRTKQSMVHADGGVRYFSYTYYIIRTLSYTMNNRWLHKGIEDTVSTYYIELEESQDKHIRHGFVKIGNLVIDTLKKKLHDFEMAIFQQTFLERKQSASDRQYLDKFHWMEIELDPRITQHHKPVKGFIKSLVPPSIDTMASYHANQLIITAKKTSITNSELLKMIEEKFDGKVILGS
jgi:hypothetical protein